MKAEERLPVWVVLVAAGAGERLGGDRPKAFMRFAGRTLLGASLAALEDCAVVDGIVIVVPEGWEERTTLLADDLCASKTAAAVSGGASRADSVAAGLDEVPAEAAFVLVHDAARPLVSEDLVDRVVAAVAAGADGAVPALSLTDTIKRVAPDGTVLATLDRTELRAVQTPQGFAARSLREAIAGDRRDVTDCASLVERAGGRVIAVEGDPRNLKVTTAGDLARAEALYLERHGTD